MAFKPKKPIKLWTTLYLCSIIYRRITYNFTIFRSILAKVKINFALMKINFATMKINFAIMKIDFALMKINFAIMKINFAIMKIDFAHMKINFAIMKINFALMKINFALMKINFAKMKTNFALIEICQLCTNENLLIIQKRARHYIKWLTLCCLNFFFSLFFSGRSLR